MTKLATTRRRSGFTLIELLVVIGIIGVLIAITIPVVSAVRQSARQTQCASNMRQLAMAMIAYAGANRGAYPPNSGALQLFWYQEHVIGPHIGQKSKLSDGSIARGVFVCPNDLDDSVRSYSMNVFASSNRKFSAATTQPTRGRGFRAGDKPSSQLMLLLESWCELPQPIDSATPEGYAAQAHIGYIGKKPGVKFGAGTGIVWEDPKDAAKGRFDIRATQIDFHRHDRTPGNHIEDPSGAANFAFADGHVELLQQGECADLKTGVSLFHAMWSPIDREMEALP